MAKKKTTKKNQQQTQKTSTNLDYSLPERLKYLRERRKLTQLELAKIANVSQSTIAQIESGMKDPSITTVKKLSEALNTHIAVLFSTENVHVFQMDRLRKDYDNVDKLSDSMYAALGKVVQYARDIGYLK